MQSSRIDKSQTLEEIIQNQYQQKTFIALVTIKFEKYCNLISASLLWESTLVYLPKVVTTERSDKAHTKPLKRL